jgi:hypothetical protein
MMPAAGGLRLFGLGALGGLQPGVSDEALWVARRVAELAQGILQSATGQRRFGDPVSELAELMGQCTTDDWDGQGAAAIPASAFREALLILCLLPSSVSVPGVLPEPTGSIALEWYRDPQRVFIISVSGTKTIEYAALFAPGDESHGRINFEQSLPERLLRDLQGFLRG